MTKTIKLRHTRTFITMFISSLSYIFPKFLSKIHVKCFNNQNKVNILCCSKIQTFLCHQNVTRRSSNDCILFFVTLEPFFKTINSCNHLSYSTIHLAFLLLLLQPFHLHLSSMTTPTKVHLQYFV